MTDPPNLVTSEEIKTSEKPSNDDLQRLTDFQRTLEGICISMKDFIVEMMKQQQKIASIPQNSIIYSLLGKENEQIS